VRRRLLAAALAASWAGVAACGSVRETPISGSIPHSVLVGPVVDASGELGAADRDAIAGALVAPLRERGYRVPSLDRAWDDLEVAGLLRGLDAQTAPGVEVLRDVGRAAHVDAVLTVVVRQWEVRGSGVLEAVQHDVEYVMRSTATGGEMWRQASAGGYQRPSASAGVDDLAERGPALTPVQGAGQVLFRTPLDAMRAVHRWAMARLPAAR